MPDRSALLTHLRDLSAAYDVTVPECLSWVVAGGFRLPPGYNGELTEVLIYLPEDYPRLPPGVGGAKVYIPAPLRYRDRPLCDVHPNHTPGWGNWAWLCFESIAWDPTTDDLATFLELVRTTLTDPRTK